MRHVYENDRLLPEKFVYFVTPEKSVKHSVFGPSVVIRRIHKLYKGVFSVLNIRIHHLLMEAYGTMDRESSYFDIVSRSEIKEENRRLRRLFLRYKEAELVYSIQHKKLLELAGKAGAIYRIDGTVLINREIFEDYLEQFHEKSTLLKEDEK